ncbi:MAG: hypothetical protein WC061_02080 [Melioribacteraceae bacterium]
MEKVEQKSGLNNIAFYVLMTILGLSVVTAVGYLFYSLIFG